MNPYFTRLLGTCCSLGRPWRLGLFAVAISACGTDLTSCSSTDCMVVFQQDTLVLGSVDGEDALLSSLVLVWEVGQSQYVFDDRDPGRVRRYVSGRFQGFIGRFGDGPGEYRAISGVFPYADDLLGIIDGRSMRLTILRTDDWSVVETRTLPAIRLHADVLQLPSGQLVANGVKMDEVSVGMPLHLLSADGDFLRSFGAQGGIVGPWDQGAFRRAFAASRHGGVWAAHRNRYVIEKWDTTGVRVDSFHVAAPWFPGADQIVTFTRSPDLPPTTSLRFIHEDESGLLWVYLAVPRADWAEELVQVGVFRNGDPHFEPRDSFQQMFDTHIDVIDPVTHRIVASGILPRSRPQLSSTGRFFQLIDESSAPRLQAWHVVVQPHSSGGG